MDETRAIIKQEQGSISWNFEQMKGYLKSTLEEYRTAVFTDESIPVAKKVVASLRKDQKEFKSRITEVKKEYMKPFDEFKSKADELVSLYDEPINVINDQISDFEERRKEQKRGRIRSLYEENVSVDMEAYIPLSKIYNPKWENATFTEKEIVKEMTAINTSTEQSVATIQGMHSDAVPRALEMYRQDLSLANAIAYVNGYEAQKAEILRQEQERQHRAEIERVRHEERERVEAERKAAEEKAVAVEQAKQEVVDILTPVESGDTRTYTYCLALSEEGKDKFEMYLDSVGIEWEQV